MKQHKHNFIEEYNGFIGFGFDRPTDENTIIYYLQKFSDDTLISKLIPRLSDNELNEIFELISKLLKKHISDEEYHALFLKDDQQ